MAQDSPNWRMADRLAGGRLDELVEAKIAAGQKWERISRDLLADYGADVSAVTLRAWYGTPAEQAS